MARFSIVSAMLLLLLGADAAGAPQTFSQADWDQSNTCRAREAQWVKSYGEEQLRRRAELLADLAPAKPDGAADATRAATRGEWGLLRVDGETGSSALGLECRDGIAGRVFRPLVRAADGVNDVPGSCGTFGCDAGEKFLDYALAYNRTLVSRADYPYRDICRVAAADYRPPDYDWRKPDGASTYGFRTLADPDAPRSLAEAARRGNIAALERLATAQPHGIDAPDDYRLTPLAWAIIYRQPEAARWLLGHGAAAWGAECNWLDAGESPLRLALETGQDDLALTVLETLPADRRPQRWGRELMTAAITGGADRTLVRMLRDDHQHQRTESAPLASTQAILDRHEQSLCWNERLATNAEIHLIVVENGAIDPRLPGAPWWSAASRPPGRITVDVTPGPRPKFLVIAADDETYWTLRVRRGAKLAGVIAAGDGQPHVAGVPAGVHVVRNWSGEFCRRYGYSWGGSGSPARQRTYTLEMIERAVDHEQTAETGIRFRI